MVWWAADKSIVQRSALIAGLSLALGGITLAGIGEWSAGHVDSSAAEGRPPASLAASSYSGSSVTAAPSALPDLPDPSDHMPANSPGYTFRHDVPEVRLQFTVADERGRLVNDLTSGDVRVFDNQSPVAHFNEFERDDDLPLQLGLLLDTSDSVKRILPQEKPAAIDFLDQRNAAPNRQRFRHGFRRRRADYGNDPTANRQQLVEAIAQVKSRAGVRAFLMRLYAACTGQASSGDRR